MPPKKAMSSTKKTAATEKAEPSPSSPGMRSKLVGREMRDSNHKLRGMSRRKWKPQPRIRRCPNTSPSKSPSDSSVEQFMGEESWELLLAGDSDHTVFIEHRLAGRCPGIPVEDLDGIQLEHLVMKIKFTMVMISGKMPPILFVYTARQLIILVNVLREFGVRERATLEPSAELISTINSWWLSDPLSRVKRDALPLDVEVLANLVNRNIEATVDPDATLSETLKLWIEDFQDLSRHILPRGSDILRVFDDVIISEDVTELEDIAYGKFTEFFQPICFSWAFLKYEEMFKDDLVEKINQRLEPIYQESPIQNEEFRKDVEEALAGNQPSPHKWLHIPFDEEEKALIREDLFMKEVDFWDSHDELDAENLQTLIQLVKSTPIIIRGLSKKHEREDGPKLETSPPDPATDFPYGN